MGKVQSLMKEKGASLKHFGHEHPGSITLNELKSILKTEFASDSIIIGFNILKFATLMQSLGWKEAINLDGGGSSSLWVKDKIVHQAFGDEDESLGLRVLRPVYDAIVFKKPEP